MMRLSPSLAPILAMVLALPVACGGKASQPSATPAVEASRETLYARLGGVDTLRTLVDSWILEAASDPRIRDFFVDADMGRLKLRLVERLCVLTDGPCMYRGAELRAHHASLGIEERHMRAFLDDLEPALERAEIRGEPARELREALLLLGAQIGAEFGE